MPGGLSLQQDQGFEEPLARVLRGGRDGTLPGDREGPRGKNRRGVRGSLWRDPSHAPWPGRPVAPLVRGHAAWALGEIGGAAESLMEASETEKDTWCLQEIRLALTNGTTEATLG